MKKYYFIAGMPRSGSTLLSAILDQNPKIHAGPASPVLSSMITLHSHMTSSEYYVAYPKEDQMLKAVGAIMDNFYSDIDKPIIIDKDLATNC